MTGKMYEKVKNSRVVSVKEIVALAVLFVLCVGFVVYLAFAPQGLYVEVYIDGELEYNLPISENTTVELEGLGTIHIENGSVTFVDSTCPDHICERMSGISGSGQQIICLPNKLVIKISGESELNVDAVT